MGENISFKNVPFKTNKKKGNKKKSSTHPINPIKRKKILTISLSMKEMGSRTMAMTA